MPQPAPEPSHPAELLSVTDDLLLTEEQVQSLTRQHAAPPVLHEATLQTTRIPDSPPPPPPPPVAAPRSTPAAAAPATRTVVRRVIKAPGVSSGSAGPAIAAAAVVLLGGGAAAWWILREKPADEAPKSKIDEVVASLPSAQAPSPAAKGAPGAAATDTTEKAATAPPAAASTVPQPAVRSNPVLAAELFDYSPSSALKGLNGGIGWSGGWIASESSIARASLIGGLPAAAGPGGHVVMNSAAQVTLSRPLTAPPWDEKTGGEWWTSLLISQTGGDGTEPGELLVNLQSGANINAAVVLKLVQNGSNCSVNGTGAARPAGFPWEAGAPIQFVTQTRATPAAGGAFDWAVNVWFNPLPDQVIKGKAKPDLILSAKAAPAPSFCGVSLQKPARKAAGTVRLDDILIGRTPASVMP